MNILVVLIPVSLFLGCIGVLAFVWTVQSDQYDDDQGNASRILLDDMQLERMRDVADGSDNDPQP